MHVCMFDTIIEFRDNFCFEMTNSGFKDAFSNRLARYHSPCTRSLGPKKVFGFWPQTCAPVFLIFLLGNDVQLQPNKNTQKSASPHRFWSWLMTRTGDFLGALGKRTLSLFIVPKTKEIIDRNLWKVSINQWKLIFSEEIFLINQNNIIKSNSQSWILNTTVVIISVYTRTEIIFQK